VGRPAAESVPAGAKAVYDAVAREYDAQFSDELDGKALDRALLAAFLELSGPGPVADVGCGPGHVTRYLSDRHQDVRGVDLSPEMIAVARQRAPGLPFHEGSLQRLPAEDGAWSGVVALYSIIHLAPEERPCAFTELARVLRPGGCLLVSFHVEDDRHAAGDVNHLTEWFGRRVDLDGYFLSPNEIIRHLDAADFGVCARIDRAALPGLEYPSQRCYMLASRR